MTVGELKKKLEKINSTKDVVVRSAYASEGIVEKVYEEDFEVIIESNIISG